MRDVVDEFYAISEVLDDDLVLVALFLRFLGARESLVYLHTRLVKGNLDKNIKQINQGYLLLRDTACHSGVAVMIKHLRNRTDVSGLIDEDSEEI